MAVGSDLLLHFIFGSCRQYRKHDNASKSELDNFLFSLSSHSNLIKDCFFFSFCRCKLFVIKVLLYNSLDSKSGSTYNPITKEKCRQEIPSKADGYDLILPF